MVKKWFWRTSIVLLVIYLNHLNFYNSEARKIGCFINEKLCDEGEYCHNDGLQGVCLKDTELGNDVIDFNTNLNLGVNEINEEAAQNLDDNSDESNDFVLKNGLENENSDENGSNTNLQICLDNLKLKLKDNYFDLDGYESKLISICKDNEYKIDEEFDFEPIFKVDKKINYQPSFNLDESKENKNYILEGNNEDENSEIDFNKFNPTLNIFENYDRIKNKKEDLNDDYYNVGKKLDQKKPGPTFDEMKDFIYFNKKNIQNNSDNKKLKFSKNDQFDFLENRKPIEEGEVRIELNEDKKIRFAEPINSGEHSPFAAVDSSYAYVYFVKKQKPMVLDDKKTKNLSIAEQSIANDDVVARRLFVQTLETKLSLPKGSFSNIKLEETTSKKTSDCATFPLMNYLIKYKQNQFNPNKWLTISFKVNPNSQNFNASLVANEIVKLKNSLEDVTGLIIIETGIGDKFLHTFINLNLFAFAFILVILSIYFYQHQNVLKQKVQDFDFGTPLFFNWINPKDNTQYNLASKPQKLSKADLEKQALDYQELCRQRMKNDFNNEIKKQEKEPKLGSNLSPKTKNQQTSNQSIENQIIQPSLAKEKDPLVSVAMNMNISTGHLILEYMENYLKQNGNKINRDWNALNKTNIEDYLESSQNAAKLCSSRNKNRYPDDLKTLPFDNSRVLLNDLESKDQTDYINASLILDADPQKPIYIATQGPLEQTICDFWQMIWEQGSSVIVMLTRLSENGVEQSARYWPEKGLKIYLHFEVNLISEHIWSEQYLVRSFFLRNQLKNETRTVTQFHYMDWPANSVPNSTAAFLEFRRKVNKSYREKSSPIVVHCSDGINRTGAYCLIDLVLNRLTKGVKEIDLVATLEHLRDQRPAMITTKEQYEFCLKAIAEEVHNLLRSIQK